MQVVEVTKLIEISKIRKYVGLTVENFDDDLIMLGNTAIKKLLLTGILESKIVKEDSMIVNTILAYIKANFRNTPNDVAERYKNLYEENKNFMRSTIEYTKEVQLDG